MLETLKRVKQKNQLNKLMPLSNYVLDEPLARHTSFRIGGNAKAFIYVNNLDELRNIIKYCKDLSIAWSLIGNGTNLLVSDKGFDGFILKLSGNFEQIRILDEGRILCGASASVPGAAKFARENSLSGLEFAAGIPGTVGGAVLMNAGAFTYEIKDVLQYVTVLLPDSNEIKEMDVEELEFEYRYSKLQESNAIILNACFQLHIKDNAGILDKEKYYQEIRKTKQPLDKPSAGSVFKRPDRGFAAEFIEKAGLKGFSIGDAEVSEKHSGFIINKGSATAKDVTNLIKHIKNQVKSQFDIELQEEIKYLGEFDEE